MPTGSSPSRFSPSLLSALDTAKIIGVRAGARSDHRFTGIWVVVFEGRVFARSWGRCRDGWYDMFRIEPEGTIQVGQRTVRVRARPVRSARMLDGVEQAYAEKYSTPASLKWVHGFRTKARREATLEFVPRGRAAD